MILAQYRPQSLIEHIGAGGPWDLNREFTGGVRILTPYKARGASDWYLGTADAVQQNFLFIKQGRPDNVLILSGDHIYEMNYDALVAFHRDQNADLTMATIRVPLSEASRFGIVGVGDDYRVTSFVEKPEHPPSTLANMGVYLFNLNTLDAALWEDHQDPTSDHDFGKNILPRLIAQGERVYAFPYTGYWVDVGTVSSYWQAHMDLLNTPPSIDLNDRTWIIHTRTEERPPVRIASGTLIKDSMITDGCVISPGAEIERSILAPGVVVKNGVVIRESIILTECVIDSGAIIERAVIDKRARIGANARIGGILPDELQISMVGKHSVLPNGVIVEPGGMIATDVIPEDLSSLTIRSDDYIQTKRLPYEL
jgi:glucose-1-phosphate adenylyltransferase